MLCPLHVRELKSFQLQCGGASPPDPLTRGHQGLCPWTPLGALPPDPRYRLALHALDRHVPPKTAHGTACSSTPALLILTPMLHFTKLLISQIYCNVYTICDCTSAIRVLYEDLTSVPTYDDELISSTGVASYTCNYGFIARGFRRYSGVVLVIF